MQKYLRRLREGETKYLGLRKSKQVVKKNLILNDESCVWYLLHE